MTVCVCGGGGGEGRGSVILLFRSDGVCLRGSCGGFLLGVLLGLSVSLSLARHTRRNVSSGGVHSRIRVTECTQVAEPLRSSSDGARLNFRGLATLWSESYSPRSTYDYVWYVAFMARCSFYSISSRSSSAVTPYVGTMAVFKTFPENVQSAAPQLEPTLEAALRKYEVHEDISMGFRCKRMKSLAVFVALDRTVEGRRIRSKKRLV